MPSDATYATQTPNHEPRGPVTVECCVSCSPTVVRLREEVARYKAIASDYKAQAEANLATAVQRKAHADDLGKRCAALRLEGFELEARIHALGGNRDDIPTVYDRLRVQRDGVEIGERVKA